MRRVIAALVSLLCLSPALAEEVFTWVDGNGVVHYSGTPPPGQKVEREVLRYDRGDPAAAAAARERWSAGERELREREAADARKGKSEEAGLAERQKACADAQEIIRRLETAPAVRYQREDGSFMAYTAEEIAGRVAEARAREQEYCY